MKMAAMTSRAVIRMRILPLHLLLAIWRRRRGAQLSAYKSSYRQRSGAESNVCLGDAAGGVRRGEKGKGKGESCAGAIAPAGTA
ncbi:hypothetical protein Mag101_02770 [Microbulbifer agarilyticus]|uniref:Uncharacterized protein n=1 Tax=Microbulbifer agarilyticus TaxID=260552 RepID=A0A1Q2M228_9GAMM|nr:hypothetical protein Mag101_02770 [Microbulbifer agarilyticus]